MNALWICIFYSIFWLYASKLIIRRLFKWESSNDSVSALHGRLGLWSLLLFPDSLTREEGSVDQNVKHPCQTVLPVTPYMAKTPLLMVLRLHNFK